jgi:hypothetical protein
MRFEIPFTYDDLTRSSQVVETPEMMANATFEGVRAAFNYWVFHYGRSFRPVYIQLHASEQS